MNVTCSRCGKKCDGNGVRRAKVVTDDDILAEIRRVSGLRDGMPVSGLLYMELRKLVDPIVDGIRSVWNELLR